MSLDERCVQFLRDASKSSQQDATKSVSVLRRFMYRNQSQRISSGAQQAICDTLVIYASSSTLSNDVKIAMLEDALAMPFTLLTSAHKKQLLRHLDRVRGEAAAGKLETKEEEEVCVEGIAVDGDRVLVISEDTWWIQTDQQTADEIQAIMEHQDTVEIVLRGTRINRIVRK